MSKAYEKNWYNFIEAMYESNTLGSFNRTGYEDKNNLTMGEIFQTLAHDIDDMIIEYVNKAFFLCFHLDCH